MDHRDLERLFDAYAQPLYGFLAYRTGDPVLAEDLVADTFERALRGRRRFDRRRASERTWLYAIALNCQRDYERRRGAEQRALTRHGPPGDPGGEDWVGRLERREDVMRAVGALPPAERDAIALRYGAGLTNPEIARVLGERLTTVEGRVYRALRRLRDALEP